MITTESTEDTEKDNPRRVSFSVPSVVNAFEFSLGLGEG